MHVVNDKGRYQSLGPKILAADPCWPEARFLGPLRSAVRVFSETFWRQNSTIMAVIGATLPLNQECRMSVEEKMCVLALVMPSRHDLKC